MDARDSGRIVLGEGIDLVLERASAGPFQYQTGSAGAFGREKQAKWGFLADNFPASFGV